VPEHASVFDGIESQWAMIASGVPVQIVDARLAARSVSWIDVECLKGSFADLGLALFVDFASVARSELRMAAGHHGRARST
jgi:hypothetical protein